MAVYEPKVNSLSITPNPVSINTTFKISVGVSDVEVVMYAVSKISGAAICGETISLATSKEVS